MHNRKKKIKIKGTIFFLRYKKGILFDVTDLKQMVGRGYDGSSAKMICTIGSIDIQIGIPLNSGRIIF